MVKPKGQTERNWLKEELDRATRELGEVIDQRWYVVEVTPSQRYSYDNGHGGVEHDWTKEKRVRVSPYFDTPEKAKAWMDGQEPDQGNSLQTATIKLYRRVIEEWR